MNMVRLSCNLTDCFFLLRRHRNDRREVCRHCEPIRRSNLFLSAMIFLFALSSLISPIHSFSQTTIKLGFLIRDKNDVSAQQAAELAIEDANATGGYKGQKFELVTRSCDGPWGITSKQAVALIYEDQVPIVVTALDGRNAHLAEQVTAKSQVVMLSTLSSDPTLSRAYVPWYFRMVPDDKQQAEVLVEQIYRTDKATKVAVIALDSYDGKMSAETFRDMAKEKGYPTPETFYGLDEKDLRAKTDHTSWDAVVMAGTSDYSTTIIQQANTQNIYTFINLFNFMTNYQPWLSTKIKYVNLELINQQAWESFDASFEQKFNAHPSPSMAYIYDGVIMATEAIKAFGSDSEAIRSGFKNLEYNGISGKIAFGKLGNRTFD
jgi:branched-chain amino acid transport system substrate-binding protein